MPKALFEKHYTVEVDVVVHVDDMDDPKNVPALDGAPAAPLSEYTSRLQRLFYALLKSEAAWAEAAVDRIVSELNYNLDVMVNNYTGVPDVIEAEHKLLDSLSDADREFWMRGWGVEPLLDQAMPVIREGIRAQMIGYRVIEHPEGAIRRRTGNSIWEYQVESDQET